jgi:hypothetical protein
VRRGRSHPSIRCAADLTSLAVDAELQRAIVRLTVSAQRPETEVTGSW